MKGIFYSLVAVLFITPLILLTMANMNFYRSSYEVGTEKIVADKLAAYIKSVDIDLPAALDIMAKRSVSSVMIYLETNGTALNDSAAALRELMTNGTLYGAASSTDFTLNYWIYAIRQKGINYGFQIDIQSINMTFYSLDNYHMAVNALIEVNASNPNYNIGIYRIYNITVTMPIEGFNDPLYTLYTNGIIKREIKFPTINVSGPANFDTAINYEFYMPSSGGPNFLDRMEGRLYKSGKYGEGGLESVVYTPELQANGLETKTNQTDMDYLYFDTAAHNGLPVNESIYGWLRIDSVHASTYNLTLI